MPRRSRVTVSGRKRRVVWWRVLLAAPLAAWGAAAGALACLQEPIIFPRRHAGPEMPGARPPDAEVLWRTLPGGERNERVEAWFVPGPGEGRAPLVVRLHGNAELIDHYGLEIERYRRLGFAVLLPEYRGYGRSGGTPSEAGIVEDVVAFVDMARARADVDPERVLYHGTSLGGAVAAQVAARRPPAALVLESAPFSIAEMAHQFLMPAFLVRHPFRTGEALRDAPFPVLIFHGRRDEVIPVDHGRRLRDAIPRAIYVEYDCGHNDLPLPRDLDDHQRRIAAFVAEHLGVGGERPEAD